MLTCAALAFALSFINDNDGSDDDDGDNGIRLSDSSPESNAISRSSRGGTFLSNDPNIAVVVVVILSCAAELLADKTAYPKSSPKTLLLNASLMFR